MSEATTRAECVVEILTSSVKIRKVAEGLLSDKKKIHDNAAPEIIEFVKRSMQLAKEAKGLVNENI